MRWGGAIVEYVLFERVLCAADGGLGDGLVEPGMPVPPCDQCLAYGCSGGGPTPTSRKAKLCPCWHMTTEGISVEMEARYADGAAVAVG